MLNTIKLTQTDEMKKFELLGLGLLLSIILISCSKDGDPNQVATQETLSTILPKKVNYIENIDYDKIGRDTYLTYNGNKLVSSILHNRWKSVFTYTGDLITKIENFDYGVLFSTTDYTYTNGKLDSRFIKNTEVQNPYSYMTYYVHNTDGTISYSSSSRNGKLTFKDGNLINDGYRSFEYDTKNNPFINIVGIGVLSIDDDSEVDLNVSKNNRIKSSENGYSSTNSITFNSNGYPTVDNGFYNGSTTGNSSYKYYYE
ncbi:hypothetical protein H8R23_14490 [Flavobacterium sp. F-380]|uniref:Lipoprotein n=1 Tax=Flavobacterium kayseriense TaxID=2764714 RepID=A0ABR7JBB6_9FLAO|nr:hypothetical protein [Flavobacterium kayseriense]MBC5842619.1 hypothetical protein [Flavobacterium kayseriense]MBC5849149.1 hypothetical protein [Flavobacterium kayseriense]